MGMRIISKRTLRDFWEAHPDSEQALKAWHADVLHSTWKRPIDITRIYATARPIKNERVVFEIKGNQYRLIVRVNYQRGLVFIRFIGTHAQYDRIDAETV